MALTLHGTVSDNTVVLSRQNANPLIINGDMAVAQRGTSVTGLGASGGYFTVDRFNIRTGDASAGRFTMTQTADAPTGSGFQECIKLDCTTADTSIAAGERLRLEYIFEGQDLQLLRKGTSDAKPVTVSFYVKGNGNATYMLDLEDGDNSRDSTTQFAVTSSWSKVVINVPADTTGALDNDNAASLYMHIWLHAGATYTGGSYTAGTWASQTNANRAVGISSLFSSTANNFFITGIQMEVGEFDANSIAPFQHETYADNLSRCERYCQSTFSQGTAIGSATAVGIQIQNTNTAGAGSMAQGVLLRTVMRAVPTIVVHNQTGGTTGSARRGDNGAMQALASGNASTSSIHFENSSGTSANIQLQWQFSATAEL